MTSPFEIARRYAQLARSLCPSLQFVRVENWAWQITGSEGVEAPGADIYNLIKLRGLRYEEVLGIELFGIHCFIDTSGLPKPEEEFMVKSGLMF